MKITEVSQMTDATEYDLAFGDGETFRVRALVSENGGYSLYDRDEDLVVSALVLPALVSAGLVSEVEKPQLTGAEREAGLASLVREVRVLLVDIAERRNDPSEVLRWVDSRLWRLGVTL